MICVDAERVGVAQPDKVLFEDLSVTISSGERVAVVGINGSGKSTLLRLLTGAASTRRRHRSLRPRRPHRVARPGSAAPARHRRRVPRLDRGRPGEGGVAGRSPRWRRRSASSRCSARRTDELSGGQAKRVALAKALVGEHDLIVLDEPTNHLDLEAIEWLETRLSAARSALVLVTHDRHVLDRLTTGRGTGKVVELDDGRGYVHVAAEGSSAYATYLDARAARHRPTRRAPRRRGGSWPAASWRGCDGARPPGRPSPRRACARRPRSSVVHRRRPACGASDLVLGVGTHRLGNQVVELDGVSQRFGDVIRAARRRRADRARVATGRRRSERVGEVDAARHHRRACGAERRHAQARLDRRHRVRRSALVDARSGRDRARARRRAVSPARLRGPGVARTLLVRFDRPVRAGADAVGRRAPPAAARHGAGRQAEPARARRTDERSRPRHAARRRGVPRRLAGRARRRQPRPGVPRPDRRPRAGDRRRRASRHGCRAASGMVGVALERNGLVVAADAVDTSSRCRRGSIGVEHECG